MYARRILDELASEVRAVLVGASRTHRHLRDRLTALVLVTVVVDLVCAAIALALEKGAKGSDIDTFGSALFWTSTQLLTVSSSLPNPLTTGGRVLDVAMEAYAITVVAGLAGAFGSFMVRRGHERDASADRRAGSPSGA